MCFTPELTVELSSKFNLDFGVYTGHFGKK